MPSPTPGGRCRSSRWYPASARATPRSRSGRAPCSISQRATTMGRLASGWWRTGTHSTCSRLSSRATSRSRARAYPRTRVSFRSPSRCRARREHHAPRATTHSPRSSSSSRRSLSVCTHAPPFARTRRSPVSLALTAPITRAGPLLLLAGHLLRGYAVVGDARRGRTHPQLAGLPLGGRGGRQCGLGLGCRRWRGRGQGGRA